MLVYCVWLGIVVCCCWVWLCWLLLWVRVLVCSGLLWVCWDVCNLGLWCSW